MWDGRDERRKKVVFRILTPLFINPNNIKYIDDPFDYGKIWDINFKEEYERCLKLGHENIQLMNEEIKNYENDIELNL